jgi:hypothetical protein
MAQLKAYDSGTSAWVPVLGSQGPTGPTGATGTTGATGATGATPTSDNDQLILAVQVFG